MAKEQLRVESRLRGARLESKRRRAPEVRVRGIHLARLRGAYLRRRSPSRRRDYRGARRLSATNTDAFVAPRFVGKFRQLWTILATIMAIAMTAPTMRNRSCDDLTIDFTPVRIQSLPMSCLSGHNTPSQDILSQDLDRST